MIQKATIVLLLLFSNRCFAQPAKEELFAETVKAVVDGFSKQGSAALLKFTDIEIGVYQLYHGNTFLEMVHLGTVGFLVPGRFANKLKQCKGIKTAQLQYTRLPASYNCDSDRWNKYGLFVDTALTDHMITKGIAFKNRYEPESYSQKQIDFFLNLEMNSRRIVLQDHNHKELVFYLTFMHNKWHLTFIDKASSDCSA